MAYSTIDDGYTHGLPAGSLVPSSRVLSAIDPATETFTLAGHALNLNDPLRFTNQGGALPAGLSAGTVYYAKPVTDSDSLFQVAATSGGSAIPITTAGTGATSIVVSLLGRVAKAIEAADGEIDEALVGHSTPLVAPIPPIVVQWSAKLWTATIVTALGLSNERWKDSAMAILDEARRVRAELVRYRMNGITLKGSTDQAPLVAEDGAAAFGECDRGWSNRDENGRDWL